MKVLLVQPSRLQPDGSIYKNSTRWLLGMTLPYVAALTPPGIDVAPLEGAASAPPAISELASRRRPAEHRAAA